MGGQASLDENLATLLDECDKPRMLKTLAQVETLFARSHGLLNRLPIPEQTFMREWAAEGADPLHLAWRGENVASQLAALLEAMNLGSDDGGDGGGVATGTGPEGNRPRPRHAEGTRFVSLFGESGDTDEAIDVQTGPDAEGVITLVLPGQEGCYMAEFPCGICVFISEEDLADARYYRVLEHGPGQDGGAGGAP